MTLHQPSGTPGRDALQAILAAPGETLLAADFDGTLAPIIDDPEQAYADPAAIRALGRLGASLAGVAVITGRPARTAVRLGDLAKVPGLESMVVLGQYGVERWDATTGAFDIPAVPAGVAGLEAELPDLLTSLGLTDVRIEHKGRAIGLHTRELEDSNEAMTQLAGPVRELAERHGLRVEPGRNVLELRPPGMDKGAALRDLVAETGARQVIFIGDDLGDLPAFRAAISLREQGIAALLVCSASHEEDALTELSDLDVDGPSGVTGWLTSLADRLERTAGPAA